MDSKELVKLVDWGTTHNFDSLLVQRHGKIVAEAYYVHYAAVSLGAKGPHHVYSSQRTTAICYLLSAIREALPLTIFLCAFASLADVVRRLPEGRWGEVCFA